MVKNFAALIVALFCVVVTAAQTHDTGINRVASHSHATAPPCLSLHDSITTHDTLITSRIAHITAVRSFWIDYDFSCINNFFYFITHAQSCSRAPVVRDTVYRDTTYTDTAYLVTVSHDSTYTISVPCPVTWFGLWGNGDNVTQKGIDALRNMDIGGWRPRFKWSLFEPVQGQFDTGYILSQLRLLAANGLEIVPMLFVGDNSPEWIYATVPRVKTTTGQTFPYYLDATYQQYTKAAWAKFLSIIEPYCMGAMCAEGSTGDRGDKGGYKGEPVESKYAITREVWTNYRYGVWHFWHELWLKIFMANPGNGGDDLSAIRDSMQWVGMIKQGNFTHGINTKGDSVQAANALKFPGYIQAEFEGRDVGDSSWRDACATDIALQAAFFGVDVINIAPNKASYEGFKWANTYCGTDSMFWYPHFAYRGVHPLRGIWWDDICEGCVTSVYNRGISVDGGDYGFRDGSGAGLFGRYYWSGSGVVRVSKPCVLRIWYRDGIGTLQVGSRLIQGRGTGKELWAEFEGMGSVSVRSELRVFLVEGK